mgnify:CR=1 FL=1
MGRKSKKIITFIVLMVLTIVVANALFRFLLPIKPIKMGSESMAPTYNVEDILFYSKSNTYKVDDIIIYKPTSRPQNIVARIIEQNQDGTFKVKGDANRATIPPLDQNNLKEEQIIGKVAFGTNWYVFYPLSYGIQIIIALILTQLIYPKLKML